MPNRRKNNPGPRSIAEADLCLVVQRLNYSHTVEDAKQDNAKTRRGDILFVYVHERDGTNVREDRWFYNNAVPDKDRDKVGILAEWRPTPENYVPRANIRGDGRNQFYAQTSPMLAYVFAFNVFNIDNKKVAQLTEASWDETAHADVGSITTVRADGFIDSSKAWNTDIHAGKKLTVGRREPMIVGNTSDTVTIERNWVNVPTAGELYVIEAKENEHTRHMDRRWRVELGELPAPMQTEINVNHYLTASWTFLSSHIKTRRVQSDPGTPIGDEELTAPA